jgi:hypothetical protein
VPIAVQLDPSEVVNDRNPATADKLDSLLRQRTVASRRVEERRDPAVGVAEGQDTAVAPFAVRGGRRRRLGVDADRRAAVEERQ